MKCSILVNMSINSDNYGNSQNLNPDLGTNFYFYRLLYVNRLRCDLIKNPDTENTCSIFAEYFPVILKY
ncbi:hypothetical protein BpHYR1_044606 [Brachionus plicatilis]|uniref:Uncharacterized protein n=1 Tax=Brachionus plicatilis TaxID=10195 RepID=A0A3M7PT54_BRAPC|nr:hypothetical protein BpHYR1_044606 [Brachionus plicatilis]